MSHKFKIEIELENKDYCNGCPCLRYGNDCSIHKIIVKQILNGNDPNFGAFIRPEICKQNEVSNDNHTK